jgi:hypothetical protein
VIVVDGHIFIYTYLYISGVGFGAPSWIAAGGAGGLNRGGTLMLNIYVYIHICMYIFGCKYIHVFI